MWFASQQHGGNPWWTLDHCYHPTAQFQLESVPPDSWEQRAYSRKTLYDSSDNWWCESWGSVLLVSFEVRLKWKQWVKYIDEMKVGGLLSIWRFEMSAWIPWTTGNENFPSVRSSAKPLFDAYCEEDIKFITGTVVRIQYQRTLKIHEIITDLEKYPD